jgi:putative transposase
MLPKRKPLRLQGYDYGQNGAYYITVCTYQRTCLFGDIINGEMVLNDEGRIIEAEWLRTPLLRNDVLLDEFIIMPNHVHMILFFVGGDCIAPPMQPHGTMQSSPTLGTIMRGFKSSCTKQINHYRQTSNQPVWQRGYHDHIVRNEHDLNRIRQYIINNPLQWADDTENPDFTGDAFVASRKEQHA